MKKTAIKAKNDFHCDKCGLKVDSLYFHQDKEICEVCKKKDSYNGRKKSKG